MAGIETRRRDPASSQSGPQLAALMLVGAVVLALPAAEVLARALTSSRWDLPSSVFVTAWGVLTGTPGQGYGDLFPTTGMTAGPSLPVPPRWLVVTLAVALEALVLAGAVWAGQRFAAQLGGNASNGFATTTQARDVLGETTLHKRRHEIRPDLYPRHTAASRLRTLLRPRSTR